MPSQLEWYEPEQIMLLRIDGDMALDEMRDLFNEIATRLDAMDHIVHFIFDARAMGRVPSTAINQLEASNRMIRHRNFGWLGMVGMTAVSSFWLRMFSKILGLKYGRFDTVEEAAAFLHELDRVQTVADDQ